MNKPTKQLPESRCEACDDDPDNVELFFEVEGIRVVSHGFCGIIFIDHFRAIEAPDHLMREKNENGIQTERISCTGFYCRLL